MQLGFSVNMGHPFDADLIAWSAEQVQDLEYFRFEVAHERIGHNDALGAVDDWVEYDVLPKLNPLVLYDTAAVEAMRRIFGELKGAGKETAVWSHELAAPREILQVYPELTTPRGDLNLAHPLMTDFVLSKYDRFFAAVPEVDVIVLTLTEVHWPVAHRFDNEWSSEECLRWLIHTVYEACARNGKKLVVRPFSAIVADYEATKNVLLGMSNDVEVMLKSDPFDWDPFLPINPALATYPAERLTIEFDLGSEYFGRGGLPVVYPQYLQERIEYAREIGAPRLVGRLDRRGKSALACEGRLNVELFCAYANDPKLDTQAFLAERVGALHKTSDAAELANLLCQGFEVVKKMFYVGGHLLWHNAYGSLVHAQRCVIFETLRDGQDMAHCQDEWAILHEKPTLSRDAALAEKREAVALATKIATRMRAIAPDEADLNEHAESLLLLAKLYLATVEAVQAYLDGVADPAADDAPFRSAADALTAAAKALHAARSADWLTNTPRVAVRFADDLRAAFDLERKACASKPGLATEAASRLEDMVACGYPGEGHKLCKYTHGSSTALSDEGFVRAVKQHVQYTLATSPGAKELQLAASGAGRLTVSQDGRVLATHEWDRAEDWADERVAFASAGNVVNVRVERVAGATPIIGMLYLLARADSGSDA